jgi:ABC-type sugar transport system substrate-binding protein
MKKFLMHITAAAILILLVMPGVFAGGQQDTGEEDDYLRVEYTLEDVKDVKLMNGEKYGTISIDPINPGRPLKVGFSQMEVNNTWRIVNNESFQHAAKVRDIELVYRDAQSSIEKQNRDVIDILNEGVDYLILSPYEYEGLGPALAEAAKKGVPVILSDREASGVRGEDYVCSVLGDFIDVGYDAASWLREQFGKETVNAVEITGTAGSSVARDLSEGFRMFAENDGNFNIVTAADGNFGRAESLAAMENIIQAYDGQFNCVFGHVDDAAIASAQALKAAGYTPGTDFANGEILTVSMCGYKEAFDGIIAGELGASVECTAALGTLVFDIIEALEEGETVPMRVVVPGKVYDSSNVTKLYHEAL